jgi:geranylgeranyl diphosphate synthase type I
MQEIISETAPQPISFEQQFVTKLEVVNAGVAAFAELLRNDAKPHGPYVAAAMEGYTSILESGGKRTRGVLTMTGYELFGGSPQDPAIARAAAIMEAEHAYLLVLDDVADASDTRRGIPAAHRHVQHFLEQNTNVPDGRKMGEDLAVITASDAHCMAQVELQRIEVPHPRARDASILLNEGLSLTAKGQVLDISSPVRSDMTREELVKIATYKTAFYSYLLPIKIGGVLAGASIEEVDMFRDFALNAGLAFQMRDDIIGLFGDEALTGKPPKGDIIEGKRTILYTTALEATSGEAHRLLQDSLGNRQLPDRQFAQCLDIIEASGAKAYAQELIEDYAAQAVASLHSLPGQWPPAQMAFLCEMALYGARRNK